CPIEYRPLALAFHQDRASDEELQQQAFGYGRGMALLYARHAEFLPWGMIQRALRARMSIRRTLAASFRRMAHRVGRADAESVEFADYLAMWDRWFWRGFDHERQSPGRAG
ncbi:MAG TPA: hypothetical protein VFG21_04690, partial [Xanthomonadaceae bacterium]|nr:hypothetical protein [Xanthomonadaceae bacterium]